MTNFYLLVATEQAETNKTIAFSAFIIDHKGEIQEKVEVLVREFFLDKRKHPFRIENSNRNRKAMALRKIKYDECVAMIADGRRMLASVNAINKWLSAMLSKYNPLIVGGDINEERTVLNFSGIDVSIFEGDTGNSVPKLCAP